MNQSVVNRADRHVITQPEQPFEIHKFPREFKRNWIKSLDFRFLSIFCCTLLLFVLVVRYLYFKNALYENVSSFKQAYIQFFDNRRFYESIESLLDQNTSAKDTDNRENDTSSSKKNSPEAGNILHQGKSAVASETNITLMIKDDESARHSSTGGSSAAGAAGNGSNGSGLLASAAEDSSSMSSDMFADNAYAGSARRLSIVPEARNRHSIRGISSNNPLHEGAIESLPVGEKAMGSGSGDRNFAQNGNRNNGSSPMSNGRKSARENSHEDSAISRVIVANNQTIQECYKQALSRNPNLKGKITIRFCVSSSGYVKEVKIIKSTLHDEIFESCIISKVMDWKDFGVISSGSSDEIFYRQTYVFGK